MPQTGSITPSLGRSRGCACEPLSMPVPPLADNTPRGYIAVMRKEAKTSCLRRLSRIEGQVRGLARMVEDDRYCIDIVTQIAAVRAALRKAEEEILRDHVA